MDIDVNVVAAEIRTVTWPREGHISRQRGRTLDGTETGERLGIKNTWDGNGAAALRVCAGPLIAETLMGTPVSKMLGRHPRLLVGIHVDHHTVFPEMLRNRHIDFFIANITELEEAGDLTIRKLAASPSGGSAGKGIPLRSGSRSRSPT